MEFFLLKAIDGSGTKDEHDFLHENYYCVKSVRIRSYSGPYFPAFGLKTEIFSRIRTEYGEIQSTSPYLIRMRKIRTRITLNTDTFHTVYHGDIEVDYSEVEKEV